jgi:hypothetical protein
MATTADADADTRIPTPAFSRHALDRYDARAPAEAIAPEQALAGATPDDGIVSHPRFGSHEHDDPDRVWLYTDTTRGGVLWTMAFIESDGTICTCWRADEENYPHIRAYLVVRGLGGLLDE